MSKKVILSSFALVWLLVACGCSSAPLKNPFEPVSAEETARQAAKMQKLAVKVALPAVAKAETLRLFKLTDQSPATIPIQYWGKALPALEIKPLDEHIRLQLKDALARELGQKYEDAPLCHQPKLFIQLSGAAGNDDQIGICKKCLSYDFSRNGECLFVRSFGTKDPEVLRLLAPYLDDESLR